MAPVTWHSRWPACVSRTSQSSFLWLVSTVSPAQTSCLETLPSVPSLSVQSMPSVPSSWTLKQPSSTAETDLPSTSAMSRSLLTSHGACLPAGFSFSSPWHCTGLDTCLRSPPSSCGWCARRSATCSRNCLSMISFQLSFWRSCSWGVFPSLSSNSAESCRSLDVSCCCLGCSSCTCSCWELCSFTALSTLSSSAASAARRWLGVGIDKPMSTDSNPAIGQCWSDSNLFNDSSVQQWILSLVAYGLEKPWSCFPLCMARVIFLSSTSVSTTVLVSPKSTVIMSKGSPITHCLKPSEWVFG